MTPMPSVIDLCATHCGGKTAAARLTWLDSTPVAAMPLTPHAFYWMTHTTIEDSCLGLWNAEMHVPAALE